MEFEEKMLIVNKTVNHNSVKYSWVTKRRESILEVVNLINDCREKLDEMIASGVIDYNNVRIVSDVIDRRFQPWNMDRALLMNNQCGCLIRRRPAGREMMTIRCAYCGESKTVRLADVKRGWGKYCCKSHAAIDRELHKLAMV